MSISTPSATRSAKPPSETFILGRLTTRSRTSSSSFPERGMPAPARDWSGSEAGGASKLGASSRARRRQLRKQAKKFGPGSTVEHAKYGRGTVLRLEGSGDDTKVTVSFPGIRIEETDREIRRNQDRMNTKKSYRQRRTQEAEARRAQESRSEGQARRRRGPRFAEAQSEEDGQGPAQALTKATASTVGPSSAPRASTS